MIYIGNKEEVMKKSIETLKERFIKIKNMGWVKSERYDSGAIGITFENLLGIPNNEFELPDFDGI